jgi:hypothetical protein
MIECIQENINAFGNAEPNGGGAKTSAAPANLFKIDDDCEKLDETKVTAFHNLVAKILLAAKRARPDTCTAVAFLATRVREPDQDNWAKLVHLMKCIRGTKMSPLIPSASGSGILKWWTDASFAVHPKMRGNTRGSRSVGRGFPIVKSTKLKPNEQSSAETEIVGVDHDCMPAASWTRHFMIAQEGHGIRDNVVHQDNKSAILMEKNNKASGAVL